MSWQNPSQVFRCSFAGKCNSSVRSIESLKWLNWWLKCLSKCLKLALRNKLHQIYVSLWHIVRIELNLRRQIKEATEFRPKIRNGMKTSSILIINGKWCAHALAVTTCNAYKNPWNSQEIGEKLLETELGGKKLAIFNNKRLLCVNAYKYTGFFF